MLDNKKFENESKMIIIDNLDAYFSVVFDNIIKIIN